MLAMFEQTKWVYELGLGDYVLLFSWIFLIYKTLMIKINKVDKKFVYTLPLEMLMDCVYLVPYRIMSGKIFYGLIEMSIQFVRQKS